MDGKGEWLWQSCFCAYGTDVRNPRFISANQVDHGGAVWQRPRAEQAEE